MVNVASTDMVVIVRDFISMVFVVRDFTSMVFNVILDGVGTKLFNS